MDHAATALAFFDAWEKADYDTCMAKFATKAAVHDRPRGNTLTDAGEIHDWIASWRVACPDSTGGARVPVASADAAVVEGVYVGTNSGPLGPFPATGKRVEMPFSITMHFDSAGRIDDYSVYYDQVTLLTQLGHLNLG